ncbi:hypothetical protein [Acidomonas methanolica]|uniref:hypothetical protein n=1 Tax=Acidomonas methanolica TaxID=437 RepID=UPI00211A2032|nr:hypothetical protein [Acidomonas methanolica]MCQ9156164.1 hypothetical protein [Acidomonas methanolica]
MNPSSADRSPTGRSTTGASSTGDNLLRLPPRTPGPGQRLTRTAAARYLGVSPLRLGALNWLGAGPEEQGGFYRLETLDRYIAELYRKADLSDTEMTRRTHARAAQRLAALTGDTAAPATPDPFVLLATRSELVENGMFFLFKLMALFGLVLMAVSISPLIHTHF